MWSENLVLLASNYFGDHFISEEFQRLLDTILLQDFKTKTGIEDLRGIVNLSLDNNYFYSSNENIQTLGILVVVINRGFPVQLCWKLKSEYGIPIRPFHKEIDLDNIEMWFDALPVQEILQEFNIEVPPLFLDETTLSYTVKINHIFADGVYLQIECSDSQKEEIANFISDEINAWNVNSERECRKDGVFHNGGTYRDHTEGELVYHIDLGSASEPGLIHILTQLNAFESIKEIQVTSFLS